MQQPSPDSQQEDARILAAFAQSIGITPEILMLIIAHAVASHLRQHPSMTLPIQIGLPSPSCATCTLAQRPVHFPTRLVAG